MIALLYLLLGLAMFGVFIWLTSVIDRWGRD
jgi:hypothetical protein